ncbi:agmatine deiminase family protein [Aquibaculum sediminis]|uniref:agmatine deiminase family protein n=1 Tax=Aquibaculum sediminis TaxID=3231907 RepID=UPI0034570711
MRTPRDDGFRVPAEWAPHARCWMAWPCRESLWGDGLEAARDAYAAVAKAIADFEPVTMLAEPDCLTDASVRCGSGVACMPMEMDDSWMRDSGPTFLLGPDGALAAVDWVFNAWGQRYRPYDRDAALARQVIDYVGAKRYPAPLVTEGGALHVDGEGTLLAVEPTLVNDNRNPGKNRAEIEALLLAYTGCSKLIWLPGGLHADETDGHVDNVACFASPGVVAAVVTEDRDDPSWEALQANLEVLRSTTDAAGRKLKVVPLPLPKAVKDGQGGRLSLSYVNFYVANGGVILPGFDDAADDKAFDTVVSLFPGRRVVQVPVLDILRGGGGIHCITQQQPAPPAGSDDTAADEAAPDDRA